MGTETYSVANLVNEASESKNGCGHQCFKGEDKSCQQEGGKEGTVVLREVSQRSVSSVVLTHVTFFIKYDGGALVPLLAVSLQSTIDVQIGSQVLRVDVEDTALIYQGVEVQMSYKQTENDGRDVEILQLILCNQLNLRLRSTMVAKEEDSVTNGGSES